MFSENSMNTKTCAIRYSDQYGWILKRCCSIPDVKFLILNGLEGYFSVIANLDHVKKNQAGDYPESRIKGRFGTNCKIECQIDIKKGGTQSPPQN